jgi:NodT family efflux transporter outer membrane factor (OMF) lipoprotein
VRAALFAALLAACAPAASKVTARELALPQNFDGAAAGPSVGALDWRAYFGDATLAALVGDAIAGNPDLQIAVQRIEIARASVRAASGARLPSLAAVAGGSVTRYGRYTPDGTGNATTDITPGRITPNPLGDLSFGVQATWEVDLWGKLGNLHGAARAQYLATVEGANLVVTNLVAEVAVTYYELLARDHVRDLVQETIARQTEALEMIRAQKDAGRTTELAVQQFEAQLASTRALAASTVQETRELENRLSVLRGRLPQPIARTKASLALPVATTIAAGVPSELLQNRADIRAAELGVRASKLDVAAARAAFYPSLTLTADAGFRAFSPRYLLSTPDSIVASLAAGLFAPLVNRRALEAAYATAQATQLQAIYQYQATVLTSFAEVANGMSALTQTAQVVEERRRKQAAVAGTVEAADALFRAGKATYLEVLLAQQNTLEAELELIEALRDQHIASVQVYRALGGGWRGVLAASGQSSPRLPTDQ